MLGGGAALLRCDESSIKESGFSRRGAFQLVTSPAHEITERLFTVRRMFRVNDSLADDSTPRWQWSRGGGLLVDRFTGRISPINLREFDVIHSPATWYRDYAASCGVSGEGKKSCALVAQRNRRNQSGRKH